MSYLILGFFLLLFWGGWGLGLALWILPPGWRRYLWALVLPIGMSFQIATVWAIAMSGGTVGVFGPWMNVVPLIFLGSAFLRPRLRRSFVLSLHTRFAWSGILLPVLAVVMVLLPAAVSKFHPGELTTFSFGSCDAPDYVMGVRLFLEQGRSLQGGFWSQPEVHQLPEGMTLWTYWTRFNHFGPAALMAMMSATFRLEPWQIGTVMSGALSATAVPVVLGFARFILRLPLRYAFGISLFYAFSPLCLYAVFHVALAQLIGTTSVGGCMMLACHLPHWRRRGSYFRAILTGAAVLWLLLSSYTFMALFVGILVLTIAACQALSARSLWRLIRVILAGASAGLVCGVLFPKRVQGFWEGVVNLGGGVFGWSVAPMQLQTVIGLPADRSLNPLDVDISSPMVIALGALWSWGVFNAWRQRDPALWVAIPSAVVILGLSYVLRAIDPNDEQLNSYKAYKLVAAFLPVLLPSLLMGFKYPVLTVQRFVVAGFFAMIALFLPRPLQQIWRAAEYMPLRVTPELARLAEVEKDPEIKGINIISASVWKRLWVSAFLANKRQFFAASTYITRGIVPLEGEWTVEDDLHGIYLSSVTRFGGQVVLRRTDEPALVALYFGPGWWQDEGAHRWSGATGRHFSLFIDAQASIAVNVEMEGVFKIEGTHLRASIDGNAVELQQKEGDLSLHNLTLRAGRTEIRFDADRAPEGGRNKSDARVFLYKLTRVQVSPAS